MADYSFSSSAIRKKKSNLKASTFVGESSEDSHALPEHQPAHQPAQSFAPVASPIERQSGRRSQPIIQEESKDVISSSGRSNSSGGSKVKQYISNLNNSQWPPPPVVSDVTGPQDHVSPLQKPNRIQHGKTPLKSLGKKKYTSDSSSDDSSEESSSDSELGPSKTIDKYRMKYLNGDIDGKIQWANTSETGSSSSGDSSKKDTNNKYDMYRKQLNESKNSDEKWILPKKKLGAPPAIEYNYRYMNTPKMPPEEKPKVQAPTPDTKPKREKVELQSKKIAKDDLGILSKMLDDDSSYGDESSHGIFSTNSEDDTRLVGIRNSNVKVTNDQELHSENLEEDSVDSRKSSTSTKKKIQGVTQEAVQDSDAKAKTDTLNDSSNEPLSIRMAKLQQLRREKAEKVSNKSTVSPTREFENAASQPVTETRKESMHATMPQRIREDEAEEDLGHFLQHQADKRAQAKEKAEISERSEDDFSQLWGQSVAAESRTQAQRKGGDDSSAEGSIEILGRPNPLCTAPPTSAPPASPKVQAKTSRSPSSNTQEVAEKSHHSASTLEASNSTSHYESSGKVGSSERSAVSEEASVELMNPIPVSRRDPAPPPSSSTKRDQMKYESSDSESDGSIDFEKLTGLEQFTMRDSGNNSLQLETPVISNKKEVRATESSKKDAHKNGGRQGHLISTTKEDEEDYSEVSLDAVNFEASPSQRQPARQPEQKQSSHDNHDDSDDESMSDFSLNPSKDLVDEKSSTEFNKPEYVPQRNSMSASLDLNDGFQGLDSKALLDLEDPKDNDSASKGSKPESETNNQAPNVPNATSRKSLFSTGFVRHLSRSCTILFVLGAIGLPIYFVLFYDSNSDETVRSLDMFPRIPTFAPTTAPIAPPTVPPMPTTTIIPTTTPTPLPMTVNPTLAPTRSRISLLREFLVSIWPSLEDDFVGISSPQYLALDWLANNANYEEYSEDRLVQRFALATLFYSTKGQQWRRNDLWLSDEDECTWYSGSSQSQCDDSGLYIRLELDLNDLSGTIPSEVALMTNLQEINFSKSGSLATLSSTLPTEIGLLANLQVLNLRGNDLTGSLVSEVGNLVNLENLDLSINRFTGVLPNEIGGMNRLRFWNLAENSFDGSIPTSIGLMTGLQKVQLSNNNFSGPVPTEIGRLSLLNSVDLYGNNLSRLPTEIGNLILLQKFSAANNQLQGPLPSGIGNSIELLSLQLQDNSLTGTIPTEIGNLIEIRDSLDLSNNLFSGPIPTELGRLIFLRNMILHSNQLTGGVPTSFAALRRLSVLRLETNDLNGVVPNATCAVFNQTFPVFVTDCTLPEITCPCCMFCCEDFGSCSCQFSNTDLEFLCSDFTRAPGLEDRMTTM